MKNFLLILLIPVALFSQNLKNEKIVQAEFFVANGEIGKAIKIYSELFNSEPSDIKIAKRLAELYLWSENVPGAISVYETLLKSGILDYDILTKLGQWYLWDGRVSDAVSIYEKLVHMYPDSVNFYRTLAKLYVWTEQPRKAIPIYERIIELDPLDYESLIQLAQQYVWNEQQVKAIPLYKKIVALFPDSANFHWMLCQLLVWNNRTNDAKREVEKFLKKFPEHKGTLELAMQLHYYSGEWDVAIKEARKLLELEPENQFANKILNEIKASYSDYIYGEVQWFRDTNKLTKIVLPFESRYFFNRFWEMNFNIEGVELVDDRISQRDYGYGGFISLKYNFTRGDYFRFGVGAFKYKAGVFPVWGFSLALNLYDRIYPQFTYGRSENREGVKAIDDKIIIDRFTFTIYNQIFSALGLSFLVNYGIYSDGNIKRTYGGYLNFLISKQNPRVLFAGFYAFEDFDSIYVNSIPYWTPNELSTYWVEINIEQSVFRWFDVGIAGAIAKNPGYPTSVNYRFWGRFKTQAFELYGLYERYGSTVYNYRLFRVYLRFKF